MSTNYNINPTTQGGFSGMVGSGASTSARSSNPRAGDIYYNNGNQEMWDGTRWIPLASTGAYLSNPVFTGTQIATTQYVNNSMSGKITFNNADGTKKVSVDEVIDAVEFMKIMKRRMCILEPALDKHEHYPALKEAYENYLLIERLCCGDDIDEE